MLLSSCRTEELLHEVGQKEELSKKFITFTKKYENDVIDYGAGFKSLALRYDSIHKTNMTGRADIAKLEEELQTNNKMSFSKSNEVAYIDFNVRSQLMEEENGDKWMVFPRVKGKEVVDLVMAILSEEETLLNYYTINKESELYKDNVNKFEEVYQKKQQKSWNVKGSSYTTFSMVERGIEPVDMIGRRPIKPIFVGIIIPILPPNLGEDIGRCSAYEMCTDIGPEVGGGGGGSSSNIIDKLDNYPCAKSLLAKMPNLNNDLAKLLRDTFGTDENVNVIFKPFTPKKGQESIDGFTNSMSGEEGYFKATISLNENILKYSTQEYILVTMYHEVIHAFLDREKSRLGREEFNRIYPDIHETGNNKYVFLENHTHFDKYISKLEETLHSFNPKLSNDYVSALSQAGIVSNMDENLIKININERDIRLGKSTGTKCSK